MQLVSFSAAFLNSQAIFKVEQGKILSYFFYQENTASERKEIDSFICMIKVEILFAQLVQALCRSAAFNVFSYAALF